MARLVHSLNRRENSFIETFQEHNSKEDMDSYVAETFGIEKQADEIRDPNRLIFIARLDGKPAGFFHLLKGSSEPSIKAQNPIELLRLYVDSSWHGKGIGVALMDKAIQIARAAGFETLWLGVWEENFRAQVFYKKYGFEVVGSHIFKIGSDEQTDLIMSRLL